MADELDRPIVILGAARSGTTLLAQLLEAHPDLVLWLEAKYLWRYRQPPGDPDTRAGGDATPEVKRYIRRRLKAFVDRGDGRRLLEKTPSNCFRVPFVDAVLPGARYVHVIRDGRDVAVSARQIWDSREETGFWQRLSRREMPTRDLPAYALPTARRLLRRQIGASEAAVWGPVYPGMREDACRLSRLELCGMQWMRSVEAAEAGLAGIDDSRVTTIRFETLVGAPEETIAGLLAFLELADEGSVPRRVVEELSGGSKARLHRADPVEFAGLTEQLRPLLVRLGYLRAGAAARSPGS